MSWRNQETKSRKSNTRGQVCCDNTHLLRGASWGPPVSSSPLLVVWPPLGVVGVHGDGRGPFGAGGEVFRRATPFVFCCCSLLMWLRLHLARGRLLTRNITHVRNPSTAHVCMAPSTSHFKQHGETSGRCLSLANRAHVCKRACSSSCTQWWGPRLCQQFSGIMVMTRFRAP